jgi:M6 family metalloprotease-like protein
MKKIVLLRQICAVKWFLPFYILAFLPISAKAQEHIFCDRGAMLGETPRAMTRGTVYDSSVSSLTGEHRVPVVLAAFKDLPFTIPDVEKEWDAMLNQSGFSKNGAAGCVSDYFKKQSGGKFSLTFDVLGPVLLPDSVKYYGKNSGNVKGADLRPEEMIWKACLATEKDFSPYDWDGDGIVDVVMVVFAGHGENRGGNANNIWPHKFNIYASRKVGDIELFSYACASELAKSSVLDGYGTFIHEFSHCLGLPDLYPGDNDVYSYFDEWDLMDGGNYANNSWSPPNYSAFERQRCGWLEPVELTSATSIIGMPSMDEEPIAYLIRNDDDSNDYYLLENRQQRGWDAYVPGNGLLITHVNHYGGTLFPNNVSRVQVGLVYADNRSYRESEAFFGTGNKYTVDGHNNYLSLAAYPYIADDIVNDHLSDTSVPAMTFHKPISNIIMSDDGHISFDFLKEETAIRSVLSDDDSDAWYDLQGRRLQAKPQQRGVYIHNRKKVAL